MVAKRKIAFQTSEGSSLEATNPPKTVRRNTRERNRVRQIDQGFEKLRVTIPTAAAQKKISRVKILSSAVDYIQHLHTLLAQVEGVKQEVVAPLPTPPKNHAPTAPHYGGGHFPGYMEWHYPSAAYSPWGADSPSLPSPLSSGYYSHSPRLPPTPQATPQPMRNRTFTRDSLSPGSSTYSDTSLHSPYLPPALPVLPALPPPQLTQDPTPSSTFREEDELLDSIVQWEKY